MDIIYEERSGREKVKQEKKFSIDSRRLKEFSFPLSTEQREANETV